MKKTVIFLLSVILIMNIVNLAAQNPFCEKLGSHVARNTLKPTPKIIHNTGQKPNRSTHLEEEGCNFKFLLESPTGFGWSSSNGIQISVDGVDYGIATLPFGGGSYEEVTKKLPSGEVQFRWLGFFDYVRNCFEIYNSSDSLIYKSDLYIPPDEVFLTYLNECIECFPITDLKGEYIPDIKQVNLTWTAPESADLTGFDIYRNDELIDRVSPSTVFYSDNTSELEEGNYKYCVIPVYPPECDLEDECITNIYVGIKTYSSILHLYPNPANNTVNITGADIINVKVFNNVCQLLLNQDNKNVINVSALTNGIYILSIETLTGYTIQKKLIINH